MWTNKQKNKKQDQLLRCFCPHWVFPAPRWRWRCCILLGWRVMPSPSVVSQEGLSSLVSGDQSQAFSAVWKAQPFEGGPGGKQGQTRGLRKSRVMFLLITALLLYSKKLEFVFIEMSKINCSRVWKQEMWVWVLGRGCSKLLIEYIWFCMRFSEQSYVNNWKTNKAECKCVCEVYWSDWQDDHNRICRPFTFGFTPKQWLYG